MPYYNGFPATYQPMYQPYTPMQVQPQQSYTGASPAQQPVQPPVQQSNKIWVQGENGAKSYLVAPNSTVDLWDSEQQTIYIKSADASGMPTMKILDYTLREPNKSTSNPASFAPDDKIPDYATKDDFRAVSEQITALRDRVDSLTKRRRREDDDE